MAPIKSEDVLNGMKSICQYYGRSEPTILKLNQEYGFPIKKAHGGWTSARSIIDAWHLDYLAGDTGKWIDKYAA